MVRTAVTLARGAREPIMVVLVGFLLFPSFLFLIERIKSKTA